MNPNVATLILAGAVPVVIGADRPHRTPPCVGAYLANGCRVCGQRISRHLSHGWLLHGWAVWTTTPKNIRPAYAPSSWDHPDAHWDQIPPEVLAEFVEGS